jgi:hypothetical protein
MLREDIITGNAFKNICDDFLDDDKKYIDITKKPKIIFLKTDWIERFKQKVLPLIDYKFNLVTHNADRPAVSGNLDLLEDNRLIKWFGMNVDIYHSKLQPIPIGIANEKWPHGNKDVLLKVINENNEKKKLVYSNFDITTNYDKRYNTLKIISTHSYIDFENTKLMFEDYTRKLSTYKYVISPPGNSVDCHRIWESIYLGVVPIVEEHPALDYYKDLPILFVKSFNNISVDLLEKGYSILKTRSVNRSCMSFYKKKIL